MEALCRVNPEFERFSTDARAIVSEPLSEMTDRGTEIPEASAIVIEGGEISTHAFEPRK